MRRWRRQRCLLHRSIWFSIVQSFSTFSYKYTLTHFGLHIPKHTQTLKCSQTALWCCTRTQSDGFYCSPNEIRSGSKANKSEHSRERSLSSVAFYAHKDRNMCDKLWKSLAPVCHSPGDACDFITNTRTDKYITEQTPIRMWQSRVETQHTLRSPSYRTSTHFIVKMSALQCPSL